MQDAPLVLLVEDDQDIQEVAKDVLEGAGYSVEVSRDGGTALMRLAEGPPPALVLLDWTMPNMGGAAFLQEFEARTDLPRVAIVLLTAVPAGAFSALKLDRPVLHKPFDLDLFLDAVAKHARPHADSA